MSIRAVIFDISGVFIQENRSWRDKWLGLLGRSEEEIAQLWADSGLSYIASVGNLDEHGLEREIGVLLRITPEQVREYMDDMWSAYTFDHEFAEFVKSLRPRYKTATVSNAWPDARAENARRFQLDKVVDMLFYSAEEGMIKPDLRLYRRVLDRLEVRPEEVLYVEDTEPNIYVARRMGMWTIRFENREQAIAEVEECLREQAER